MTPIKSALISVYHKDNLEPIIKKLHDLGVVLYSTGGTEDFIRGLNIPVNAVEDLTDYPSILGGRVKTLHPKIFGGILGRREEDSDIAQLEEYAIPQIDLVIVDLYPFEETLASGASEQEIIEKIDIGGISLIRAAAKNFKDVMIIPGMEYYDILLDLLDGNDGSTSLSDRKQMAAEAFDISSHYDAAIYGYFMEGEESASLKVSESEFTSLRYGENPHQQGRFYGDLEEVFDQLHGKELSYNNLLDVDAAVQLMGEFHESDPTFVVMKHNNACGVATRKKLADAYRDALAGDPTSAFGGVLISNRKIDAETASAINKLFCEVVIAPGYDEEALELLKSKKNRIILVQIESEFPSITLRTALNGVLWQEKDGETDQKAGFEFVTNKKPTDAQLLDLEFASKICKHTKSNTIVLAKNNQLLASGTGQTSRVDALMQAIIKAKHFGFDLKDSVMASDAFFPFPDCVEIAGKEGVNAVIQPGGSIKDKLSIDYCNENGIAMVFTGTRHFKH
ncbi:bifunctional phosphoribosylaminoimidazolecarboxamide formyltransferase/IMP cyclohydrolase [Cryomorpha ignava]|uniref:Bifunctional purine biosynthesis protein PurH n=1 Tax=Cryomorpha ignava TaxID=101383 RepID=A0A7K3WND7_9FLAO|nr:bifunctional phosphoribosylaminoimidazolecarboxamide formyltransferase/IMP cyclohydrolase [Cryomorpha ignava]NEN23048.1 bifunctional phosphoribosylaminoimidazolecarboxamide formyltransferase/IMP cyclohydrolase [Cryomorpha ignava]